MDGLDKMTTDNYKVIPDNRKELFNHLQKMYGQGLCRICLGYRQINMKVEDFSNMLLIGLSCQKYNEGKLDLLTLYKTEGVYNGMIRGLDMDNLEYVDFIIDQLVYDIQYVIHSENGFFKSVEVTLCTGEVLTIEFVIYG